MPPVAYITYLQLTQLYQLRRWSVMWTTDGSFPQCISVFRLAIYAHLFVYRNRSILFGYIGLSCIIILWSYMFTLHRRRLDWKKTTATVVRETCGSRYHRGQIKGPLKSLEQHGSIVSWGLRGTLIWFQLWWEAWASQAADVIFTRTSKN